MSLQLRKFVYFLKYQATTAIEALSYHVVSTGLNLSIFSLNCSD